jgi:hypothetical protein
MINPGWRGEYYLQQDLEGRRKLLGRLVGSLYLEPATRQWARHFDMERIPDRYKLDPDADGVPADFTLAYGDLERVESVLTERV